MSEADLNRVARALRELLPSTAGLDRDKLMFRAGGRSVPFNWKWPLATALVSLLALVLGLALLLRSVPRVIQQPVYVRVPAAPTPEAPLPPEPMPEPQATPSDYSGDSEPAGPASPYFRLQEQILRWGLDGVQQPPPLVPPRQPQSLESFLKPD